MRQTGAHDRCLVTACGLGLVAVGGLLLCGALWLGGSLSGGSRGGLVGGPDPAAAVPPGPPLVRRKGPPLWPEEASVTTAAAEDTSGPTAPPATTTAVQEPEDGLQAGSDAAPDVTVARPSRPKHRGGGGRLRLPTIDWDQLVYAVNRSLSPRVTKRLSELADLDPVALIKNSSSLVSFGLLAMDLFLLHNVQRIAFTEKSAQSLKQDPEVMALNSLFDGTQQQQRRQRSRGGGLLTEMVGYLQATVRGLVNLGRAYRGATRPRATSAPAQASGGPTVLDCIWTLYCRSLDKTARLSGPYGFLAKMNSFGLRLMLGEFSPDDALEKAMTEMSTGFGRLNCDTLFPKCGVEEAKRVVMAAAQQKA